MQITLMRHGKPLLAGTRWIAPQEMAQWIARYNQAEVEARDIPAESAMAAMSALIMVASTIPRALSSAKALGKATLLEDAVFSEAELPFALWRAPRLPPAAWAAIFRLLWFFGYSRGSASFKDTQHRANAAARQLVALAMDGPVLLVGHGIMNRLIGKELQALGWTARTRQGSRYWSMGVYGL